MLGHITSIFIYHWCSNVTRLQNVDVTIMSYVKTVRITLQTLKGFIDEQKPKSCIEKAVEVIFKAAMEISEMPIKD